MGVIANGPSDIRVAFSSVDMDQLEDLYDVLAAAARELLAARGGKVVAIYPCYPPV